MTPKIPTSPDMRTARMNVLLSWLMALVLVAVAVWLVWFGQTGLGAGLLGAVSTRWVQEQKEAGKTLGGLVGGRTGG